MTEKEFEQLPRTPLQEVVADLPTPTDVGGALALFAALTVAGGEARGASVEDVKADWHQFLDALNGGDKPAAE